MSFKCNLEESFMILMLKVNYLLWLNFFFFFIIHSKGKNADLYEHMFWVRINSYYDCNTQLIYILNSAIYKNILLLKLR